MNPLVVENESSIDFNIDQLCQEFSLLINSIVGDVSTLREIASVYAVCQEECRHPFGAQLTCTAQTNELANDMVPTSFGDIAVKPTIRNPSTSGVLSSSPPDQEVKEKDVVSHLHSMNSMVSILEQKISSFHVMMDQAKQTVRDMERLHLAAVEQSHVLGNMKEILKMEQVSLTSSSNARSTHIMATPSHLHTQGNNPKIQARATFSVSSSSSTMSTATITTTSNHNIPHIHLLRISNTELESVSRNIRGRLSLLMLNDALEDIERVAQYKYTILAKKGNSFSTMSQSTKKGIQLTKNHNSSTQQYRDVLALHRDIETDEHEGLPWVTEQELRDSCSFFRGGESTARSILFVLRTLKRLKQAYGKAHQVTYICLSDSSSSQNES